MLTRQGTKPQRLSRESCFSFECSACGLCCRNKKIPLNPYEIAGMARHLSVSTAEFLAEYVRRDEPFLLLREGGSCVFLEATRCGVHPVRPLVCRLYPLGQHLTGEGKEHFTCAALPPECNGVSGASGTVAEFLKSQETVQYMEASGRYLKLFYRLYRFACRSPDIRTISRADRKVAADSALLAKWFDLDLLVASYCRERDWPVPADLVLQTNIHIEVLERELGFPREVAS